MIGRVIAGKYKIYDEVGSGGFATVYLGRNMDTNEIVAIKVLGDQFTREARYVERFRREAALAERLQHPNIVRILDHGIENGMHFLVMEFVEGLTLDKIIGRKGRLAVGEAVSYAEQACAALQAAYEAGIVHRDIKPANLMITPAGSVKVMDFGIARLEAMSGLTQSGIFMGTPRYISPEMAIGVGADIRSDLYALGLLTYEMLAGAPPFDADNPWAVLRQQIEVEPQPLRRIRSDVPAWLEAIVMRAIAKDPNKRFQTPAEMLAALQGHTATPRPMRTDVTEVRTTPVVATGTAGRSRQKQRRLILVLAGAAVILILGLVALVVFGLGGGSTPPEVVVVSPQASSTPAPTNTAIIVVVTDTPTTGAETPSVEPSPSATDTPLPEPTSTQVVLPSDTPLPSATLTTSPTGTPSPTETPPPTQTPSPTDTPLPAATPTRAPTDTPSPPSTPTSPPAPAVSGKLAYSVGGNLSVVDVQTKTTLFTVNGMRQPDFRRDGAEILADGLGNPATVVNINASTGAIIREQTAFTDDFHPSWSPDGTRFAYDSLHHGLGQYTMLYTQGLTNRNPLSEVTLFYNGQQIRGHSTVWTHDDLVAFTGCDYWPGGSGGSNCGIYVMPSWSDRPTLTYAGSTNMRATDNHGGQLVFMSQESGDWEVYSIPNRGGTARNLSQSPSSQDGLGTFSPDGKRVAFASNRGGGWAVWMVNADGSGTTKLFNLPGQPTAPWYEDNLSWGP